MKTGTATHSSLRSKNDNPTSVNVSVLYRCEKGCNFKLDITQKSGYTVPSSRRCARSHERLYLRRNGILHHSAVRHVTNCKNRPAGAFDIAYSHPDSVDRSFTKFSPLYCAAMTDDAQKFPAISWSMEENWVVAHGVSLRCNNDARPVTDYRS